MNLKLASLLSLITFGVTASTDGVEIKKSATGTGLLKDILPPFAQDGTTTLHDNGMEEIITKLEEMNVIATKANNANNLRSRKLQSVDLEIINDCSYDMYIDAIYSRNGLMAVVSSQQRVNKHTSFTIEGISNTKMWIYGDSRSYFEEGYKCSESLFCKSDGSCYCEVNFDSLASGSLTFSLCGRQASRSRPPQGGIVVIAPVAVPTPDPTEPPTKAPTKSPTASPSRHPTHYPTHSPTKGPTNGPTPFPTRHPTDNPTHSPTKEPTNGPTPFPTRHPTDNPTPYPTQNPTRAPTRNPTASPTNPPTASPTARVFTGVNLKDEWMYEHNSRRQNFYSLFDMPSLDLKWSDSIADSAQNYANKLIQIDGCHIEHGYGGDNYGGENLAMNYGSGRWAKPRTPAEVLEAWYDDEIDLESMQLVGKKYHASQVIWRSSRYFGCGQAEKQMDNGAECHIQVCRYIGVGNCFIHDYANHPSVSPALPPGCMDQYPGWACSALSDTSSEFCSTDQCPAEGCF